MRLLVIDASALAVAASATAGNNEIAAWCTGSQLRIAVQSAGENTTAWIGVLIRNRQRECDLAGVMTLTIVGPQRPLRIAGNPLRLRVSGVVRTRGSHLVRADWSNWCGSRSRLTLLVEYMGRATRFPFAYSPVCLNTAWPSRLTVVT